MLNTVILASNICVNLNVNGNMLRNVFLCPTLPLEDVLPLDTNVTLLSCRLIDFQLTSVYRRSTAHQW